MGILYEALLPSGRGVRFAKVLTETYLGCQERAGLVVGSSPDPSGVRLKQALTCELIKGSLRFVTQPLTFVYKPVVDKDGKPVIDPRFGGKPVLSDEVDIDATLASVGDAWLAVDAMQLGMADSPLSFAKLFEELQDYAAMAKHVGDSLEPMRSPGILTGKARRISV